LSRKRHLPPNPLAPRRLVRFDLADPEQSRAVAVYLRDRLRRLARDKREFPSEFDRLIAATEAWCREVYAEAGLKPDDVVPDDLYLKTSGTRRKSVPSSPRSETCAKGSLILSSVSRWFSVS
jgi:8-oxo-dGTP pyrophosphatase MutT (NUDIX family)